MDDVIVIVIVLVASIDKVDPITRMKVVLLPLVSTPYANRIVDVGSALVLLLALSSKLLSLFRLLALCS